VIEGAVYRPEKGAEILFPQFVRDLGADPVEFLVHPGVVFGQGFVIAVLMHE
jgi:hypothetical protein